MHFDVHCHLDNINNPKKTIEEAEKLGFGGILTNSVDYISMKNCVNLSKQSNIIHLALGIHPSNSLLMNNSEIEKAFEYLECNIEDIAAIGEIGLDFKHADNEKKQKKQMQVFLWQLELAEKYNKPVVIHGRRAYSKCIDVLEENFNGNILLHWFMGSKNIIKRGLKLKSMFSFGPNVVFNERTAGIVKKVPYERLFGETDCPVPFNGKETTPLDVIPAVRKIAKLHEISENTLQSTIKKNYFEFFSFK